jgi:hypothetical protein
MALTLSDSQATEALLCGKPRSDCASPAVAEPLDVAILRLLSLCWLVIHVIRSNVGRRPSVHLTIRCVTQSARRTQPQTTALVAISRN